jgi:hypothetical protein
VAVFALPPFELYRWKERDLPVILPRFHTPGRTFVASYQSSPQVATLRSTIGLARCLRTSHRSLSGRCAVVAKSVDDDHVACLTILQILAVVRDLRRLGLLVDVYLQSCQFQYVPVFVLPPSELYRWSEICGLYWRSSTREGGRFVASCQSSPQDFQSLCNRSVSSVRSSRDYIMRVTAAVELR